MQDVRHSLAPAAAPPATPRRVFLDYQAPNAPAAHHDIFGQAPQQGANPRPVAQYLAPPAAPNQAQHGHELWNAHVGHQDAYAGYYDGPAAHQEAYAAYHDAHAGHQNEYDAHHGAYANGQDALPEELAQQFAAYDMPNDAYPDNDPDEDGLELPEDTVTITPTPNGGWQTIQGNKPEWQYENVDPDMAKAWKKRTFAHCLVAMAGQGATDHGEAERRTIQEKAIGDVFGFKPRVVQVRAAKPASKRNDYPICNMLQAGSWDDIRCVLEAKCISVRGGPTLFFFPREPPLPTLMAIFCKPEAFAAHGRQLIPTIRQRLSMTATRDRLITAYQREQQASNVPPAFTAAELADDTIRNVTAEEIVRTRRGEKIPLVAIYFTLPTTKAETWSEIRGILRAARLGTAITGHPILYTDPLKCGTCHSVDHDTGMCSFAKLDEWYGPKRGLRNDDADDDDDDNANREEQRGKRGFRGRG